MNPLLYQAELHRGRQSPGRRLNFQVTMVREANSVEIDRFGLEPDAKAEREK